MQLGEGLGVVVLNDVQIAVRQRQQFPPSRFVRAKRTWASMTKTMAPQPPKIMSESNAGSKKSIWPGKSQTWNWTNELFEMSADVVPEGGVRQWPASANRRRAERRVLMLPFLMTLLVLSRKRVSLGDIL